MEQQTQTLTPPDMVLTPPEVIQPVEQKKATDMVALPDETTAALDKQVASVVNTLFTEDVHSDTFKSRVDALINKVRYDYATHSELLTVSVIFWSPSGDLTTQSQLPSTFAIALLS